MIVKVTLDNHAYDSLVNDARDWGAEWFRFGDKRKDGSYSVRYEDPTEGGLKTAVLTRTKLGHAVSKMLTDHDVVGDYWRSELASFISGGDMESFVADAVVQLAVMGEIAYG